MATKKVKGVKSERPLRLTKGPAKPPQTPAKDKVRGKRRAAVVEVVKPDGEVVTELQLSASAQVFIDHYLLTNNASASYLKAHPAASPVTAKAEARAYLLNPLIKTEITRRRNEVLESHRIAADEVLLRIAAMATADERELMEVRVGCCRYCWGTDHQYQRTNAEFRRAMDMHKAEMEKGRREADFDPMGGEGFIKSMQPNPLCPECGGEGSARSIFKDTSNLSFGAALLFAGVKETKEGFEVKTHDKAAALETLARHFGLLKQVVESKVTVDASEELKQFLAQRGGSRLPLAKD